MGIPNFAVKRPVLIVMVFAAFFLLGMICLRRLQVELYQGTSRGIISIVIRVRGGLAPAEVEKQVTIPVEEQVATVSRLENLYSNSREGESRVTLEFEPGTDMNLAALEVREKFARAKPKLPEEIEKPVIANYSETQSAILIASVTSASKTPEEIRTVVDNQLKPTLMRLQGVASMEVYGGRERKILVEMDRDKMFAHNISIERVMEIIGASNVNLLVGSLERGPAEFSIRTLGAFRTVEEIGEVSIASTPQGSVVPLREIATIKDSYLEPEDYARLNLKQNVSIQIKKASDANTIKVATELKKALDKFRSETKEDLQFSIVTDHAKTIKRAIDDVLSAIYLGIIITVIVIYAYLRRAGLSLLVLLSIPTSLITTFAFMYFAGVSINIMTLSGLAANVGQLVDCSVVVLENIFSKVERGKTGQRAVVEGAEEVWLALLASTITTVIVYFPIMFIDKEVQIRYWGLAFTSTVALLVSLIVSLGLLPTIASRIKLTVKKGASSETQEERKAHGFYEKLLRLSFRNRYPLLACVAIAFVLSAHAISQKDIDLPHTLEENEFGVIIFPLAGAKLDANDLAAKKIEELLGQFEEVETVSTVVRKDDLKLYVKLIPRNKREHSKDEIMNFIREKGEEAINEIHDDYNLIVDEGISSDESRKLIVNIFGHENDELEKLAYEVANRMTQAGGLTNVVMTDLRKRPEYDLLVDRGRASFYGLTVKDIADSIHAQVRGMRPTKFHDLSKGQEIETITRLQAIYRQKVDDLRKIYVMSPITKEQILLDQIASFNPSLGPNTIDRMDKYRYVFVKGDSSAALETAAEKIQKSLRELTFPQDYFYRFGGSYPKLMKSKHELTYMVFIVILLVYMVLACLFQSYQQPLIIMTAVPLALIGVYAGLWITKKPLSEHVFFGMFMLAGTVVNNSIIMVDRINQLRTQIPDTVELLLQAGKNRCRPILMTSTSTVLGFLPMALPWGQASDLWSPLAITMMSGMISSTLLTLFIVPVLYLAGEDIRIISKRAITLFSKFAFGH